MGDRVDDKRKRGPSVVLLLAGVAALVVAVSALAGRNPMAPLGNLQLGWIVVAVAVAIGLALILAPMIGRRRKA